ncbi:hypothetical protein P9112_009569 [Eukaryota sp. TZLM1-RC]
MERATSSLSVPSPLLCETPRLAKDLCSAIKILHSKSVIHGDLKPENILLVNGQLRIADFGTSKVIANTTQNSTSATFTPKYAAFEAFDGEVTTAGDLYSIGVILYELLTDNMAFEGLSHNGLIGAKFRGTILNFDPETPQILKNLISDCMFVDPSDRPNVDQIIEILNDLENSVNIDGLNLNIDQNHCFKCREKDEEIQRINTENQELIQINQQQEQNLIDSSNEKQGLIKTIKQINKQTTEHQARIEYLERNFVVVCQNSEVELCSNNDILPKPFKKALDDEENVVELYHQKLNDDQVVSIAGSLEENQQIKQLFFVDNYMNDMGAIALAQALKINSRLKVLSLDKHNITHIGCKALADALAVNSTLKEFLLDGNPIGDKGIQCLAKTLQSNRSVVKLSLRNTKCNNVGAFALSKALKVNSNIEVLDLRTNNIDDHGAEALAQSLFANSRFYSFWPFGKASKRKSRLALWLYYNNYTEEKEIELKAKYGDQILM